MFYFDSTYLLLIPAIIISMWAQTKVNSTFNKYVRGASHRGYSGAEAARIILDSNGLNNVAIELTRGKLSDHYDPSQRVLRLSNDVYYGTSLASIGVAAHECGHAIQHKVEYAPLKLRSASVPLANIGSNLSWIIFLLGLVFSIKQLVTAGIVLFAAVVIFQLITLPVEFDASARALQQVRNTGILYDDELVGAKKVLDAAAMTYIAAAIMAISQLIRLIAISRRDD
ncbi:zinc metallopeptidase [Clostridium cadaveris]|uniref:zinc metallopeptidase n=1 Tax=Clostridium cadaveris TaxID=1529 RepID=UPI001E629EF9|nr:zinc metallopeptidase [Clostridium cadaveris]UFH66380.1 zinc metallopeptidase [Clostridium cadaveris]